MNINASIVDQRLTGILKEHISLLEPIVGKDDSRQRSLAATFWGGDMLDRIFKGFKLQNKEGSN